MDQGRRDEAPDGGGRVVKVDDLDDRRLDDYWDLNDPAARRRLEADRGIILVEGRVALRQLLATQLHVRSMLVDDHQVSLAEDLVESVLQRGAAVYVVPRSEMATVVGFRLHRGIVAVADRPADVDPGQLLADIDGSGGVGDQLPLVAVLEGLNDPENIGALFRNAAAFGVAAVLLDPSCADPLYRRSIRVSVGHALHLPFARLAPWPDGLERLRSAGFVLCALTPRAAGVPVVHLRDLRPMLATSFPTSRGIALLVGAEGPGLTPKAIGAVDLVVTIPMASGVDSLNVATAAAVAFDRLSDP